MYYTTIIGYARINPSWFTPKRARCDKNGIQIKGRYDKPQQDECPKSDITKQPIIAWRSTREQLDSIPSDDKRVCNSIKSYLNETSSALWYHNGSCDSMSEFGGRHFHVVTAGEISLDGSVRSLHNNTKYRLLKKIISENQGYMKSQQVRDTSRLCQHLCCPPRVYMGSRDLPIGKLMRSIQLDVTVPYNTCVSDLPPDSDAFEEQTVGSEWDLDPIAVVTHTDLWEEMSDPWGDVELPIAEQHFSAPNTAKRAALEFMNIKDTPADRMVNILKWLCRRFNVSTFEALQIEISKLPTDDPILLRWQKLQHRPGISAKIQSISNEFCMEYVTANFETLCQNFLDSHNVNDYASIKNSLNIWLKWTHSQMIDPAEFLWEISVLIDKILPKRNAMSIVGPSNTGKTIVVALPLISLCRYCGQVGSAATSGNFTPQ